MNSLEQRDIKFLLLAFIGEVDGALLFLVILVKRGSPEIVSLGPVHSDQGHDQEGEIHLRSICRRRNNSNRQYYTGNLQHWQVQGLAPQFL